MGKDSKNPARWVSVCNLSENCSLDHFRRGSFLIYNRSDANDAAAA
jgi:hypothetical protein